MNTRARVLAFYLPQFHPTEENDKWWGKGFTEWTNVGKAEKLFKDHNQPRVPSELGYYDLRLPEARNSQAELAREYGIEGFVYWHYWFGNGKQILQRPLNEVMESKTPDFPFCIAWANESWKGFNYDKYGKRNLLLEQQYLGEDDYIAHFNYLEPILMDKRYIRIEGKPLIFIYQAFDSPEIPNIIKVWRKLANERGIGELFFVSNTDDDSKIDDILSLGFDGVNLNQLFKYPKILKENRSNWIKTKIKNLSRSGLNVYPYADVYPTFTNQKDSNENVFPTIVPKWDHSPRSGRKSVIYHGDTPNLFGKHLDLVIEKTKNKQHEKNIIFLKSWNEWAEGNYIEPDLKWGRAFLEKFKEKFVL